MLYQAVSKDNDSQESQYKLSTDSVKIAISLFISYQKLLIEFNLELGKNVFFLWCNDILGVAFPSLDTVLVSDNLKLSFFALIQSKTFKKKVK